MTKFTRILLFALCALMGGVNSAFAAVDVIEGYFVFNFYDSGKAYVKKYNGSAPEVSIPATINHDASGGTESTEVIGIGEGAFEDNTSIVTIRLLYNGKYILGARVFKGCTSLKTVNWKGAIGIGSYGITENTVYIPIDDEQEIPESAFEGCTSITTINTRWSAVNFTCGNKVFKGCTGLTTVGSVAGSKFKNIGEEAFEGCTSLASVTFANITTIGNNAFEGCTSLASVTFANVTTIGNNAFKGCTALTTPSFAKATSIGDGAFEGCTSLASVTFANVTTIGNNAFEGCSKLSTISFPKATSIGDYAFAGCGTDSESKLTAISNSVFAKDVNIGAHAFDGCTNLSTAYFYAKNVGDEAFRNCSGITYFRFYSIDSFGENTFTGIPSNAKIGITLPYLSNELLNQIGNQKEQACGYFYFNSSKGYTQVISCRVPVSVNLQNVTVQYVSSVEETVSGVTVGLTEITSNKVLPANHALIVSYSGTATGTVYYYPSIPKDQTPNYTNYLSTAIDATTLVSEGAANYYCLSNDSKPKETNIKFDKITESTQLAAGSGYLAIMTLDGDDENTDYAGAIAAHDGEKVTMNFTRGITADKWSTICLPFDLSSSQQTSVFGTGVKVAKLTDESTESTLKFATLSDDETMAANTPYAIKVASDFSPATIPNVTLRNATPSVTAGNWTFTGVYTPRNIPVGSYFFSENKLWRAADGIDTIKAFRGYFTYNSGAGAREVDFSVDGELTGIRTIESGVQDVENEYFDLQGRKVAQPTKGLYIVNGKKIIVK